MPVRCRVVLTRTPEDNDKLRAAMGSIPATVVDYPCTLWSGCSYRRTSSSG